MKILEKIKQNKLSLKPGDFILFFLLIILSFFAIYKSNFNQDDTAAITAKGKTYKYSLKNDGIYSFEGEIGTTTVEIKNGKIRIIDSPCPNKTCIALGYGTTLICLPNKVFISVNTPDEENSQGEYDAVAE